MGFVVTHFCITSVLQCWKIMLMHKGGSRSGCHQMIGLFSHQLQTQSQKSREQKADCVCVCEFKELYPMALIYHQYSTQGFRFLIESPSVDPYKNRMHSHHSCTHIQKHHCLTTHCPISHLNNNTMFAHTLFRKTSSSHKLHWGDIINALSPDHTRVQCC